MFNTPMKRQPSVMAHTFSQVPKADIPRSTFDRSHGHKTTFNAGLLIPILVDEALPGDTFKVNLTSFARLATPIFPIMDNMFLDIHFFSVPIRLLWDNWQKFNGEQINPGDSTDFLVPQMTSPVGGYAVGSLSDYMGIPPLIAGIEHSALWHRAYNLIYNQWYRDQNMQNSVPVPRGDGPDTVTDFIVRRRGKRHDYFTSCLPFPQKGPGVSIPLGGTAPVEYVHANGNAWLAKRWDTGATYVPGVDQGILVQAADGEVYNDGNSVGLQFDPRGNLQANLTAATAATINSLRQAIQIQKIYERDARGGTRYIEILKAHFGVSSPDSRLQRPEYLGGGSTPVIVAPIPQTGSTDAVSPQGNLAAIGTAVSQNGFTASFTEHCIILGIASTRADLTYQQGLNRMFSRRTRFDFYWPALSHIGEQAVLRKEIYSDGVDVNDNIVFGYQERYGEYRYKPSQISGLFRSVAAGTLDSWHLSQNFATPPVLDDTFISENPPLARVIAVPTEPHFLFDSFIQMHCARPMPVYGVPGLMDHF